MWEMWELPKKVGKNLRKQFANTYKFYNHDVNKFTLLLRKSDYPYDFIDDWEKLMKDHYLKKNIMTVT